MIGALEGQSDCELLAKHEVDQHTAHPISRDDRIEFAMRYCSSPIDLVLHLKDLDTGTRKKLLDEQQPSQNPVSLRIEPPKYAGRYRLEWDFEVVDNWQTVASVKVNDVTVYLKFKAHDSEYPRKWGLFDFVVD